jgi:hypothetical protein
MSYRNRPLGENHQLLCAIHEDRGFIVFIATVLYKMHNGVLAILLRRS